MKSPSTKSHVGQGRFYAVRRYKGRKEYVHRILLGLKPGDPRQVDHIDGNPLNNELSNLRLADNLTNKWSAYPHRDAVSRFKGVSRSHTGKPWRARIRVRGKELYLGQFDTEEEAAIAYNKAAKKYFKNYAWINKV